MLFQDLVSPSFFDARQMNILQNRLNKLFSEVTEQSQNEFPSINVYMGEEKALVIAEVPGIDPDSIDLQVVNQTLTLKTNRDQDESGEGQVWQRRERGYGQFSRSLELPFLIDAEKVNASCRKGVLKIELPRAQADLPQKIAIQSA